MSAIVIDINEAKKRRKRGKKYDFVFQFKIILKHISPPIWRRIQVPETYTFWDLHVAIQDSMGWTDSHLHEFYIHGKDVTIGIPNDEYDHDILPERSERIRDYFRTDKDSCNYNYDFGDYWEHKVVLEKILPVEKDRNYPICLNGKRACPPEDCGGVVGYEELIEILKNPDNDGYEEYYNWLGGEFKPEEFKLEDVFFSDPEEAYKHRWM